MNFEICIMRVDDLQIQIVFISLALLGRGGETTLRCLHVHTYIRMYVRVCMCMCGLAAFLCVWKRAMISIWRTSCTVRYVTAVMYLSAYLRDYNLLPYI